jgi:hypothetical protein
MKKKKVAAKEKPNHPADKLPGQGRYQYVSPDKGGLPKRTKGGGYLDRKGNIWEWSPCVVSVPSSRDCDHWDVQHEDGNYSNITPVASVITKTFTRNTSRP